MTLPLCQCGCGEPVPLAKRSAPAQGIAKGQPLKYVMGHRFRLNGPDYRVEDGGYETPCWVWAKSMGSPGYGRVWNSKTRRHDMAHRVYYEQHVGPIPDGYEIDHLCRNRACVNPAHLEPVTHAENGRRGRATKLDLQKAAEIREALARGESRAELALRYGVSRHCIEGIVYGRTWVAA